MADSAGRKRLEAQGPSANGRAQSESIPIAKKSVLRATAPEWRAPTRPLLDSWPRQQQQSEMRVILPQDLANHRGTIEELSRSASQPDSSETAPQLLRSHSNAEERTLALSESRRAWDSVRQGQDQQETRRVWGTPGNVRERPWNFLESDESSEVDEDTTMKASVWDFPALSASVAPIRPPIWPIGATAPISDTAPAEAQPTVPQNIPITPVRQPARELGNVAGTPSTSPLRTPRTSDLAMPADNAASFRSISQAPGESSVHTPAKPADSDKLLESMAGLVVTAVMTPSREKPVELDPVVAQKEFQGATLLQEAESVQPSGALNGEAPKEDSHVKGDVFASEKTPEIYIRQDGRRPSTSDFEILRDIGEGAFGRVMLIERKKTKERFAMKILEKQRIVARENQRYVMEERDILTRVEHPFIVSLLFAFQNRNKLYLVMEYLPGGELLKKIRKEGLLNDKQTVFYAGEMVLALEYLHLRNIVHRDLKPENVLLDAEGHIRLTDFGLARKLEGEEAMLKSICGTDLYMAPEMLAGKAYGKAVDFWALGCVLFEMQTGDPPFDAVNRKRLYHIIMTKNARFPSWMTATCTKFLKGLLDRNVEQRLGASRGTMFEVGGVAAIKRHDFFKKLDWTMLEKKQLVPPLKPDLDVLDEVALAREESFQDGGGSECSAEDFKGFSYVHPQFAFSPKPSPAFLQRTFPAT